MNNENELQQKDIEYLKEQLSEIKESLKNLQTDLLIIREFVPRKEIEEKLVTKVDKEDFKKVESNLAKIAWTVITGVVIALLNLIIKS